MGRARSEAAPANTMMMDMTDANIGRSIKNLSISAPVGLVGVAAVLRMRIDSHAVSQAIEPGHNYAVARLKAAQDNLPVTLDRACVNVACAGPVAVVNHKNHLAVAVLADGLARNAEHVFKALGLHADAHKLAGNKLGVGVGDNGARIDAAGARVNGGIGKVNAAFKPVFAVVGQNQLRRLLKIAAAADHGATRPPVGGGDA